MNVGIFGGTFDPIHIGHLRAAEEVREIFSLERIYFVPALIPPHKRAHRVTSSEDRLTMVKKALRSNPCFRLSEIEIKRGGISYSIDTIETYEKRFGDLYYLMGLDAFAEIDTWHRYRELFYHANFIVMVRPGEDRPKGRMLFPSEVTHEMEVVNEATFQHISGKRVYLQDITQLDISATRIRTFVRNEKSVRYLVPTHVERYISSQGLYR